MRPYCAIIAAATASILASSKVELMRNVTLGSAPPLLRGGFGRSVHAQIDIGRKAFGGHPAIDDHFTGVG